MKPIDFACPYCDAPAGEWCRTKGENSHARVYMHTARKALVEPVPTDPQPIVAEWPAVDPQPVMMSAGFSVPAWQPSAEECENEVPEKVGIWARIKKAFS